MASTRGGQEASVGIFDYKVGDKYVVLARDGSFLSLGETRFFSEESHGWDKEVTRKYCHKFLCPIEFME